MEMIAFLLFAAALAVTYIAIRRQFAAPTFIAGAGVFASIITMILFMLARGAALLQAVILGVLIGSLFAGATLAIAWYFQTNELREGYQPSED